MNVLSHPGWRIQLDFGRCFPSDPRRLWSEVQLRTAVGAPAVCIHHSLRSSFSLSLPSPASPPPPSLTSALLNGGFVCQIRVDYDRPSRTRLINQEGNVLQGHRAAPGGPRLLIVPDQCSQGIIVFVIYLLPSNMLPHLGPYFQISSVAVPTFACEVVLLLSACKFQTLLLFMRCLMFNTGASNTIKI